MEDKDIKPPVFGSGFEPPRHQDADQSGSSSVAEAGGSTGSTAESAPTSDFEADFRADVAASDPFGIQELKANNAAIATEDPITSPDETPVQQRPADIAEPDTAPESIENEPEFEVIEAAPAPVPEAKVSPTRDGSGRPVIALMGEFSAGKSTLSNLLIRTAALPVNVTATQLPPVWISKGSDAPYRVGLDGDEYDLDLSDLEQVSVHDTSYIRIFHDAEILEDCDIIDMPGISDPNMDAEVWQRVIHHADGIIWCSHATQAWRQSEAAVWSMMPPEFYTKSLLLLTRMDKILSERDQARVAKRVGRETQDLFRNIFPISLTRALDSIDDPERWEACGAGAFFDALSVLIGELSEKSEATPAPADETQIPVRTVSPLRIRPRPLAARSARPRSEAAPATPSRTI